MIELPDCEFAIDKDCKKFIHFIWLQKSQKYHTDIPQNFTEDFLPKWKQLNNDYEVLIWDDQKVQDSSIFDLNQQARTLVQDKRLNPALRADILRVFILQNFQDFDSETCI